MDKEEAKKILLIEFAKFTVKYPKLAVSLQPYINQHYDKDIAIGNIIQKNMLLEQYVNYLFIEELLVKDDQDSSSNR